MKYSNLGRIVLVFCTLLATPCLASAWTLSSPQTQQNPATLENQKNEKKKDNKKNATENNTPSPAQPSIAPKPLFGGQVNLKSSRQSKDTATLGFNGLDPNGQVQKGFLAAAPSGADVAKAQQLSRTGVNPSELTAFLQEGGLNALGGQQ